MTNLPSSNKFLDIDRTLSARLQLPKDKPLFWLALIIAHTGDSLMWAFIVVVLWYRGERILPGVIAITIIAVASIVFLIKVTVRRRRPTADRGLATMSIDEHSFPSGHAARSIGLAVVLGSIYPEWLPYFLVWAFLVGTARIALGVHYLSDVIIGWILGSVMGYLLLNWRIVELISSAVIRSLQK